MCLRSAFMASRFARGVVVSKGCRPETRLNAERAWRYAALLGGLLYPLGIFKNLGAKGESTDRLWRVEYGSLAKWCQVVGETHYRAYWNADGFNGASMDTARFWALRHVVTQNSIDFITSVQESYWLELIKCLKGEESADDQLTNLVQRAVIHAERYSREETRDRLKGTVNEDIYERLRVLMQYVMEKASMKPSEYSIRRKGSDLCALWPKLAADLRAAAKEYNLLGLQENERDTATLLRELGEAGIIRRTGRGDWVESVSMPHERTGALGKVVTLSYSYNTRGEYPVVENPITEPQEMSAHTGPGEQPKEDRAATLEKRDQESTVEASVDETSCERETRWSGLGPLGKFLMDAWEDYGHEPGWWTEKGRALPWPEIATKAQCKPSEFLAELGRTGVAVRKEGGKLPLIHEVSDGNAKRMAVIIGREAWEGVPLWQQKESSK